MERNYTDIWIDKAISLLTVQMLITLISIKKTIVNKIENLALLILCNILNVLFYQKPEEIYFFNDFLNSENLKQYSPEIFLEECFKLDIDITDLDT